MSSVVGGLESVWNAIVSLPSEIGSWFEYVGNSISSTFERVGKTITDKISALPKSILDGIKSIFIPDVEVIEDKFNYFLNDLKVKFNFDTSFFENLFDDEKTVEDVEGDYYIPGVGNMKLKFFSSQFFIDGVDYFRPFIRGFIILLIGLYHIKQLMSFIRQDAGVMAGKAESGGKKK